MNESKNIFWACFSIIVGLATVIAAVIAILSYFDIRIPWPFWEDPSAGEVVEVGQENKALDNTDGIMEPSPYCVNLGLSVRWNKRNLGALYPEEYGDYYAWGEIETKSTYSWSNYKWCKGFSEQPLKYGPVDEKYVLDPSDDVAYRRGMWRMPTAKEMEELVSIQSSILNTFDNKNNIISFICDFLMHVSTTLDLVADRGNAKLQEMIEDGTIKDLLSKVDNI